MTIRTSAFAMLLVGVNISNGYGEQRPRVMQDASPRCVSAIGTIYDVLSRHAYATEDSTGYAGRLRIVEDCDRRADTYSYVVNCTSINDRLLVGLARQNRNAAKYHYIDVPTQARNLCSRNKLAYELHRAVCPRR